MRFLLVTWMLIASGCLSKSIREKQIINQGDIFRFEALKVLPGKELKMLKNAAYFPNALVSDTTFESEDGEKWPGLVFRNQGKTAFFVETSWRDRESVSRVVIVDRSIASSSGIAIGDKFEDIKGKLSGDIPSYPDGYFGLRDLMSSSTTYFFDVSNHPNVSLGDVAFGTVPEDLIVIQIMIEGDGKR